MQTFFEYYQKEIQPKLMAIDVFLKTEPQPYGIGKVACLLGISREDLHGLLDQEKLAIITRGTFFYLLQIAPTPFCRMFYREVACGMPQRYSPKEISYIYDLDRRAVEGVARRIGRESFSPCELMGLFEEIRVSDK